MNNQGRYTKWPVHWIVTRSLAGLTQGSSPADGID